MNMRITDNAFRESSMRDIQRIQRESLNAHRELTTHQRVEKPSDDPAAVSRALHQISEKRTLGQYAKDNGSALDVVTTSHASLTEFKDTVLTRAQEVSMLISGLSDSDVKSAYVAELDQLIEHGLQVMNTKHRGEYLFAGDSSLTLPFDVTRAADGKASSVAYAGSTSARSYDVGEGVRLSPQLDPSKAAQFSSYFTHLISLRDAISSGDATALDTARQAIMDDEMSLVADLSDLGGKQMRVENAKVVDTVRYRRLDEGISKNVDTDVVEAGMRFRELQDALELAFKTQSRTMGQTIFNYL